MGKKAEQVKEKIAEIENVKKQIWALQKKLETLSLDLAALTEQSKSRVASLSPDEYLSPQISISDVEIEKRRHILLLECHERIRSIHVPKGEWEKMKGWGATQAPFTQQDPGKAQTINLNEGHDNLPPTKPKRTTTFEQRSKVFGERGLGNMFSLSRQSQVEINFGKKRQRMSEHEILGIGDEQEDVESKEEREEGEEKEERKEEKKEGILQAYGCYVEIEEDVKRSRFSTNLSEYLVQDSTCDSTEDLLDVLEEEKISSSAPIGEEEGGIPKYDDEGYLVMDIRQQQQQQLIKDQEEANQKSERKKRKDKNEKEIEKEKKEEKEKEKEKEEEEKGSINIEGDGYVVMKIGAPSSLEQQEEGNPKSERKRRKEKTDRTVVKTHVTQKSMGDLKKKEKEKVKKEKGGSFVKKKEPPPSVDVILRQRSKTIERGEKERKLKERKRMSMKRAETPSPYLSNDSFSSKRRSLSPTSLSPTRRSFSPTLNLSPTPLTLSPTPLSRTRHFSPPPPPIATKSRTLSPPLPPSSTTKTRTFSPTTVTFSPTTKKLSSPSSKNLSSPRGNLSPVTKHFSPSGRLSPTRIISKLSSPRNHLAGRTSPSSPSILKEYSSLSKSGGQSPPPLLEENRASLYKRPPSSPSLGMIRSPSPSFSPNEYLYSSTCAFSFSPSRRRPSYSPSSPSETYSQPDEEISKPSSEKPVKEKKREREREKKEGKKREKTKESLKPLYQDSKALFKKKDKIGLDDTLNRLGAWNETFQDCLRYLHQMGKDAGSRERMEANIKLMHLSEDFSYAARTVGKIIISEVHLSENKKSIRTKTIGGRAGGEKYIVHNILFKFAVDAFNLFGGSTWAAAKVANHELTGLMCYFNIGIQDVFMPLMSLVDYRGFRLVAMSVLPVNRSTLIYGTSDAGRTIKKKNTEFNAIMRQMMGSLNLKPHVCGMTSRVAKLLWSAADIEGHLGTDKKFYLLDFSRTMPPVTPNPDFYNGHLYRLMRPEFVAKYEKPLCSDAYSGFISHDPMMREHNKEIDEATKYLLGTVIPNYTSTFLNSFRKCDVESFDVSDILHRQGINLRYIGNMLDALSKKKAFLSGDESTVLLASRLLLIEAIARVIKNQLNQMLRQQMNRLKLPLEVPYRKLVVKFFNVVFGTGEKSFKWWKQLLPPYLKFFFNVVKFPFLGDLECENDWRSEVFVLVNREGVTGHWLLFHKVVKLMGLTFTEDCLMRFKKSTVWPSEPFDLLDIREMGVRVKDLNIISLTQGNFFFFKSLLQKDKATVTSLLRQAIGKYEQALNSMPTSKEGLLNSAMSWFRLMEIRAVERGWVDEKGTYFDGNDAGVRKISEFLNLALEIDPKNPSLLCLSAYLFQFIRNSEKAEGGYILALESDPSFLTASFMYGNFLIQYGDPLLATPFYWFPPTPDTPMSLVTLEKMGGPLKIYYENPLFMEERSRSAKNVTTVQKNLANTSPILFRNMDVTASICCERICAIMSEIIPSNSTCGLYQFDIQTDPSTAPSSVISEMLEKSDRKPRLLYSFERPWVLSQIPKNTTIFLYKEIPPPRVCSMQKLSILRSEKEFFDELAKFDKDTFPLLLASYPQITALPTFLLLLFSCLPSLPNQISNLANGLIVWMGDFPYDLDNPQFTHCIMKISENYFSNLEVVYSTTLIAKARLERQEIDKREREVIMAILKTINSPSDYDVFSLSDVQIEDFAKQLRLLIASVIRRIQIREFFGTKQTNTTSSSRGSRRAASPKKRRTPSQGQVVGLPSSITFLQSLSSSLKEWVRRTFVGELSEKETKMRLGFFTRLALASFRLDDFFSSSVLSQALDAVPPSFLSVEFSDGGYFFSGSFSLFSRDGRKDRKEFYCGYLEEMAMKEQPFLGEISWLVEDLMNHGLDVCYQNLSGEKELHLAKVSAIYSILKSYLLDGILGKKPVDEFFCDPDPQVFSFLWSQVFQTEAGGYSLFLS